MGCGVLAVGVLQLGAMKGRELLAWNLRRVRVMRGVSQERLAADAAVDRAYLGGLERQTENPTARPHRGGVSGAVRRALRSAGRRRGAAGALEGRKTQSLTGGGALPGDADDIDRRPT